MLKSSDEYKEFLRTHDTETTVNFASSCACTLYPDATHCLKQAEYFQRVGTYAMENVLLCASGAQWKPISSFYRHAMQNKKYHNVNLFSPFNPKKLSTYSLISWRSHPSRCPTLSDKPSKSLTFCARQVTTTVHPGRS